MKASLSLGVCVMALVLVGGCDQKVEMTFNNISPESRIVEISVDGGPHRVMGSIAPGGTLRRNIKVPKDELPVTLRWQSGEEGGQMVVDKKHHTLVANIDPKGGSVTTDGKAEIERHQEDEQKTQESHSVVE